MTRRIKNQPKSKKAKRNQFKFDCICLGKNFQRQYWKQILETISNNGDLESIALEIATKRRINPKKALESMKYAVNGNQEGPVQIRYSGVEERYKIKS